MLAISGDKADDGPSSDDSRIFEIGTGAKATIAGLTLTEGNGTGPVAGAAQGGAVFVDGAATAKISDSVITGNATTNANGGGIYNVGDLTVSHSTISNNNAGTGSGGGISTGGPATPLTVTDSIISGNTAANGGGIDVLSSTSTVISGGGAKYTPEAISIDKTTIAGNEAHGDGGGIAARALNKGDSLTVSNSTLSGNDAVAHGGGLSIAGIGNAIRGEVDLVNSTISGNTSPTGAGASVGGSSTLPTFGTGGSLSFDNSTIAANTAATTGGGLFLSAYDSGSPAVKSSPTVKLTSTIAADNVAAGAPQDLDRADNSTTGGFDLSYSLVEAKGDAPITESPAGSNILGSDPLLGALANNGGPTQTQLPDPTSPAVDHGKAPARITTDQRGDARVVDGDPGNAAGGDGSDIGAVEVQNPPVIPVAQTPANNNTPLPPSNQPSNQAPNLAPKTTIDKILLDDARSRKRRVTGTATDDKRVAFVEVAIVQKKSNKCRELRANGTFTRARACAFPKTFIVAQGTSKWSFPLLLKLPKGSYTLYARSVDDAGRYEVTYSSANQRDFTIK